MRSLLTAVEPKASGSRYNRRARRRRYGRAVSVAVEGDVAEMEHSGEHRV